MVNNAAALTLRTKDGMMLSACMVDTPRIRDNRDCKSIQQKLSFPVPG
jgi:hypothetical protein